MPETLTAQRVAIEAALESAVGPLSPRAVLEAARREVPSLCLATVYRTLKKMVAAGSVSMVELAGQPPRYESSQIANPHRHHFLCDACDTVFDLHGCVEDLRQLLPRGFRMNSHDITLHGQCPNCR
ncbi:MAG: Fur family transcriptional regulator [Planctomycetota bacterium]